MTYYPQARSARDTYHDHWSETPHGSDSRRGPALARVHGKTWIDIDATRLKGMLLICDHGTPSTAYFKRGTRSVDFTWVQVKDRKHHWRGETFQLRTIAEALIANAREHVKGLPLGSEVEIKNLNPITEERLAVVMAQLASDAEAAYGPHWQRYVIVKVCTGTLAYRLRICKAAHAAGIPTMISVAGRDRLKSFAGHTELTYVRGSLNRKIRARH